MINSQALCDFLGYYRDILIGEQAVKSPVVSIIVPTYNRAQLLPRAIRSVLRQTYANFELLIVDDGSTDETAAVVARAFSDPRITYWRLPNNSGVGAARNHGLEQARGRFIALLDSDDEWHPEKLELQVQALESAPDPTHSACYCAYIYNHGRGNKIKPHRGINDDESLGEYLYCEHGSMQTSTVIAHCSLALQARFPTKGAEDTDYFMQLEGLGAQFIFLDRPLSVYHADPRPGRLGPQLPLRDLREWMRQRSAFLSRRARRGFAATILAPLMVESGDFRLRMAAILVFLKGAILGRICWQLWVVGILMVCIPRRLYFLLQSIRLHWRRNQGQTLSLGPETS